MIRSLFLSLSFPVKLDVKLFMRSPKLSFRTDGPVCDSVVTGGAEEAEAEAGEGEDDEEAGNETNGRGGCDVKLGVINGGDEVEDDCDCGNGGGGGGVRSGGDV